VDKMIFALEEELSNVRHGSLVKVNTEIIYDKKLTKKETKLIGKLIVTREIKKMDRITEIKDQFPIDITIPKNNIINSAAEVSLRLAALKFEIEEEATKCYGEFELTNVEEKTEEAVFND
jgi:hypothetical protein